MVTATISIGRNYTVDLDEGPQIGPLPDIAWEDFKASVKYLLCNFALTIHVDGAEAQASLWDGQTETSATWVADIPDGNCERLALAVALIAVTYKQDAIALTIGQTTLVGPNTGV